MVDKTSRTYGKSKNSIVLVLIYIEWRFSSSDMRLAKRVKFSSVRAIIYFFQMNRRLHAPTNSVMSISTAAQQYGRIKSMSWFALTLQFFLSYPGSRFLMSFQSTQNPTNGKTSRGDGQLCFTVVSPNSSVPDHSRIYKSVTRHCLNWNQLACYRLANSICGRLFMVCVQRATRKSCHEI